MPQKDGAHFQAVHTILFTSSTHFRRSFERSLQSLHPDPFSFALRPAAVLLCCLPSPTQVVRKTPETFHHIHMRRIPPWMYISTGISYIIYRQFRLIL